MMIPSLWIDKLYPTALSLITHHSTQVPMCSNQKVKGQYHRSDFLVLSWYYIVLYYSTLVPVIFSGPKVNGKVTGQV